jgi:hypothetical protein
VTLRQFNNSGAEFLIIEETAEGFFLYSFPKAGIEGDTWHQSPAEAMDQAVVQFGATAGAWFPVPTEITDLPSFGRKNSN